VPASPPEMRGWTTRTFCTSLTDPIAFLALRASIRLLTGELVSSQRGCATLYDALWLITSTYWRARDLAAHEVEPCQLLLLEERSHSRRMNTFASRKLLKDHATNPWSAEVATQYAYSAFAMLRLILHRRNGARLGYPIT
jgi:hypothetical protein